MKEITINGERFLIDGEVTVDRAEAPVLPARAGDDGELTG